MPAANTTSDAQLPPPRRRSPALGPPSPTKGGREQGGLRQSPPQAPPRCAGERVEVDPPHHRRTCPWIRRGRSRTSSQGARPSRIASTTNNPLQRCASPNTSTTRV